ncbi:toxin-antitoxin system [Lactobacillus taiwanensis]|uniref:toxin-antitoxin system n=1 Tax=Lactobacillus taiwanensis TaxID=508451 RepID=UPI001AEC1663|nr:toxin-antitoxin system [Lactobacillus taiwanensis]QTQ40816.1 toxin-antitoxin system [Lactobacillus taiwanensis]
MEILKARKQGNSLMVAIPKSFDIASGTKLRPKLTRNGIYYEFVDDDFFDFDEDILRDLVSQGYEGTELINKFSKIKRAIPSALDRLVEEAKESKPLSKEEAAREFGI